MTTTTRPRPRCDAGPSGPAPALGRARPAGVHAFPAQRDAVVFTFVFPVMMILLFAAIFSSETRRRGVSDTHTSSPA